MVINLNGGHNNERSEMNHQFSKDECKKETRLVTHVPDHVAAMPCGCHAQPDTYTLTTPWILYSQDVLSLHIIYATLKCNLYMLSWEDIDHRNIILQRAFLFSTVFSLVSLQQVLISNQYCLAGCHLTWSAYYLIWMSGDTTCFAHGERPFI